MDKSQKRLLKSKKQKYENDNFDLSVDYAMFLHVSTPSFHDLNPKIPSFKNYIAISAKGALTITL